MKVNLEWWARAKLEAWDKIIPSFDFNDWIEAPRLVVDCSISKQCRWYYSMQTDIKRIKEILNELAKDPNWKLIDILREQAIILYGKLFASAAWRWVKLDTSDLNHLEDWPKKFHEYLLYLRNDFVAHAWENQEEQTQSALLFVPEEIKESAKEITGLVCYSTKTVWWRWMKDYERMFGLCEMVNWIINEKYQKAEKRLLDDYRSKDKDELYSRAQKTSERLR